MRCIRVEDKQGVKTYYCIDNMGRTSVYKKPEMLKAVMAHQIENATLYIRNGIICIRISDAVKEKVSSNNSKNVIEKVVNQIIKKMQSGVVNCNLDMLEFLDELELSEFKKSKELINETTKSLLMRAKKACEDNYQQVYIMSLRSDDGKGYEVILATTNRRRGASVIQQRVKDKIIKLCAERELTADEVRFYLEKEQSKMRVDW